MASSTGTSSKRKEGENCYFNRNIQTALLGFAKHQQRDYVAPSVGLVGNLALIRYLEIRSTLRTRTKGTLFPQGDDYFGYGTKYYANETYYVIEPESGDGAAKETSKRNNKNGQGFETSTKEKQIESNEKLGEKVATINKIDSGEDEKESTDRVNSPSSNPSSGKQEDEKSDDVESLKIFTNDKLSADEDTFDGMAIDEGHVENNSSNKTTDHDENGKSEETTKEAVIDEEKKIIDETTRNLEGSRYEEEKKIDYDDVVDTKAKNKTELAASKSEVVLVRTKQHLNDEWKENDLERYSDMECREHNAIHKIDGAREDVYRDQIQNSWHIYTHGLTHVLGLNNLSNAPDAILKL